MAAKYLRRPAALHWREKPLPNGSKLTNLGQDTASIIGVAMLNHYVPGNMVPKVEHVNVHNYNNSIRLGGSM